MSALNHPSHRLTELSLRTLDLAGKNQAAYQEAVREVDFMAPAPAVDAASMWFERSQMVLVMDLFSEAGAKWFEDKAKDRGVTLASPHIQTPYPLALCAHKNIFIVVAAAVGQGRLEKGVDPVIGLDAAGQPVGLVESMLFTDRPDFQTIRMALAMDDDEFQRVVTHAERRFSISSEPFVIPAGGQLQYLSYSFPQALLNGASISHAIWSRLEQRPNQIIEDVAAMYGPKDNPRCTRAMELLLEADFPVGYALHRACEQVRPDMVRLLLGHGADPSEHNHEDFTPKELIGRVYGQRGSRGKAAKCIATLLSAALAHQEALASLASIKEGSREPTAPGRVRGLR